MLLLVFFIAVLCLLLLDSRYFQFAHGWRRVVLVLPQGGECLPTELQVTNDIVALDLLVQVRVESHLLHVLLFAQLHEALAGSVRGVEDLLQGVKHDVGGAILVIELGGVDQEVFLVNHPRAVLREPDNLFCAHEAALGSEVDALARALGDVASGVADQGTAPLRAPRAGVLRDRMSLNTNDLTTLDARSGSFADALLVHLDALLIHHRASADGNVIILREHPRVEVWRHVLADVHLGPLLVVLHLALVNAHALLEGDRILVVPGVDQLGHPAVGTVSPYDDVDLKSLPDALASAILLVAQIVVLENLRIAVLLRQIHAHEEAVDNSGTVLRRRVPQVAVKHLAPNHADVLVVLQGLANLYLLVRGRDHGHLAHPPVDQLRRQAELSHHAERDRAAAGLAVVELPLDQVRLHAALRELPSARRAARPPTDHGHPELPALWQLAASAD